MNYLYISRVPIQQENVRENIPYLHFQLPKLQGGLELFNALKELGLIIYD